MGGWVIRHGYLLLIVPAVFAGSVRAAECPPGRVIDKVEETEDAVRTFCKCDVDRVPHGRACIYRTPTVDPAFFVSPEHAAFVRAELERLRVKRAKIAAQFAKLEQLRADQDRYLQEMGEMREQVMYDGLSDLLSVVSSKVVADGIPGLSPTDARELTTGLRLMKTAVDVESTELAGDNRDRARRKAIDACKTALGTLATLTMPDSYRDPIKRTIDATAESIKAADVNWKAADAPMRQRVVTALDGIAAITGAIVPLVGTARSGVNAAGNAIVLWHIQNDKESIVEALVSSQRARLAYDNRLAATDEMIRFYEVEAKKFQ
ncbi:hypothetical protein UP09_06675 [Bradyrhizobium sp. LTSP885]|uniref:hypothetical protein n=1 Tax=Bradyrhizobium sp. LTSP885 TaxID=1619232 RepID=UPI0005C981E3|nr:hypothetical protein [Bradyrhizobium sp. LTSP885]KJC49397.1 hypothetical protein UP09_06675 [Bradyrhizobium sp. LTSP885]